MRNATKEERQSIENNIKNHSIRLFTQDDLIAELEEVKEELLTSITISESQNRQILDSVLWLLEKRINKLKGENE